jgi:quinol monooxygenase YgiN
MILVTGTLPLQPSQKDSALDAVRDVQRETRKEPGNHAYEFSLDIDDDHLLRIHEEWESDEALSEHMATPHFATFLERIGDKLAGAPNVVRWDGASSRPLFE